MMIAALAFTAIFGVLANLIHFPGAVWKLPTFGVAFLPGIAAATVFSGLGVRRA
jgi:hypothetical protein